MLIALNASVQGMRRAGERLAEAATLIASTRPANPRADGPSPAPPTGAEGLTAAQASGGFERAMADTILARRAYEANAKAFESNAEAERALVSRGA